MIDDDEPLGVSKEQRVDQLQSDLWFLLNRKLKRAARLCTKIRTKNHFLCKAGGPIFIT